LEPVAEDSDDRQAWEGLYAAYEHNEKLVNDCFHQLYEACMGLFPGRLCRDEATDALEAYEWLTSTAWFQLSLEFWDGTPAGNVIRLALMPPMALGTPPLSNRVLLTARAQRSVVIRSIPKRLVAGSNGRFVWSRAPSRPGWRQF
jgi:hypothetical protein